MYKKILVPLDGSKRAEMAFQHLRDIAQRYEADVTCLFVIQQKFVTGVEGTFIQASGDNVEEAMQKARSYLESVTSEMRAAGIKVKSHVVRGNVVDSIIFTAESIKADLVIMTSHGRSGIKRVFYGSVAAGVLNRIDRPLLIIRSRTAE